MKNKTFNIENKSIGLDSPTYFIADIAANHDGSLEKAKELIYLSAEAGADAAKFQHFSAETIVSDFGFKSLGNQQSHQEQLLREHPWRTERGLHQTYSLLTLLEQPLLHLNCKISRLSLTTSIRLKKNLEALKHTCCKRSSRSHHQCPCCDC